MNLDKTIDKTCARQVAHLVREQLPQDGLFASERWRLSPAPFPLGVRLAEELETLGRVLLQFNRAVNRLYRLSAAGKQPPWVAAWLDQGKPAGLVELQRSLCFKHDLPRVIRPDLLLVENGLSVTELDAVPGGIGLTAWLNQAYSRAGFSVVGGARGMIEGFAGIFGPAPHVHVVISDEAASYRPEMEWLTSELGPARFAVRSGHFISFAPGDAVYRFFELFDLANVPNAKIIFDLALAKRLRLTAPPKPIFEEKMLFALLWNRNLHDFWRQELGERFFDRLLKLVPYTWVLDPTPLPPHAAIPVLNLTDWRQLKTLSQRQRDLILKVSGFSERAWGARGVYLGSDLSATDWAAAIDNALRDWPHSPFVLQRYAKPRLLQTAWYDFAADQAVTMPGRVRLCPYYFVHGDGDAAQIQLGGVLATVCPADKKIIHGMEAAILAPCEV